MKKLSERIMDRRFRDMSLTEEDVYWRVSVYRVHTSHLAHKYPHSVRYVFLDNGLTRAKRLLPLWRQLGLRELAKAAYEQGQRDLRAHAKRWENP